MCHCAQCAPVPAPRINKSAHRGADGWRSLTWLRGARPEQQASQEKAEATRGSRWFHCCAGQLSPLNSHVQRRIFPWKSQKGWLVCDWSLFSLWVWGLESLLTKFTVWPTVTASFLRTCRSNLSPVWKQKQSSLSFQRAHSKACLNSIKQDSCHYSPSWIQCAAVDSYSSDTPPKPWTPPTDSVIGTGARRSP